MVCEVKARSERAGTLRLESLWSLDARRVVTWKYSPRLKSAMNGGKLVVK